MGVAIKGQYKDGCDDENILYLDCIQVSILLLYCRFAGCYHWEKLGKGYFKSLYSFF